MFPSISFLVPMLQVTPGTNKPHTFLSLCHHSSCILFFWIFFNSVGFRIHRSCSSFENNSNIVSSEEANLTSAVGNSLFLLSCSCLFYWTLDLFLVHLELFIYILSSHLDCNLKVRSHELSPYPHGANVVHKAVPYTSEGFSKTSVQNTVSKEFLKSLPVQFRSLILNSSVETSCLCTTVSPELLWEQPWHFQITHFL